MEARAKWRSCPAVALYCSIVWGSHSVRTSWERRPHRASDQRKKITSESGIENVECATRAVKEAHFHFVQCDWFHYQENDLFTGWHLGPRTASWWFWALLPSDLSGCHLGAETLGASWTKGTRVLEVGVNSWSEFWFHLGVYCGEGNGNPLQCSCLENPRDGGAWWASIYGVAQSRTRLKRLSSSSSRNVLISSNQDKISL